MSPNNYKLSNNSYHVHHDIYSIKTINTITDKGFVNFAEYNLDLVNWCWMRKINHLCIRVEQFPPKISFKYMFSGVFNDEIQNNCIVYHDISYVTQGYFI